MPMIRMTTRSSIRVKPFSSSARLRSFCSMVGESFLCGFRWACPRRQIQVVHAVGSDALRLPQWQPGFLVERSDPSDQGPWLCVPPSRTVCLFTLGSGTSGIDLQHRALETRWTLTHEDQRL